jgi:peptidoglycan/xylan/chitin deacetylase (PgdA/CDA1 family)
MSFLARLTHLCIVLASGAAIKSSLASAQPEHNANAKTTAKQGWAHSIAHKPTKRKRRAVEQEPQPITNQLPPGNSMALKQAQPSLDATTPGHDSDAWLTADPVLGGADRIDGREADKYLVAFTFDDGPDRNTTGIVLDALALYDVPATFFLVTRRLLGKSGEVPRALMERAHREGHLIGSHTVSHRRLKSTTERLLTEEVDGSLKTMVRVSGRPVGLFRPPFGSLSKAGSQWLAKRGLTNTLWSIDTLDWQARDAAILRAKVLSMILHDEGGVVLMHDVKKMTAEIIAGVFDDLEAANCARLTSGRQPIIPVSLHYFLKLGKQNRPVPPEVADRTAAYRAALPTRCAQRPSVPTSPPASDTMPPLLGPPVK